MISGLDKEWPKIPALEDWEGTLSGLHMWSQIVGKIKLAYEPLVNHWWGIPLYVSTRGLTTGAIPLGGRTFEIEFDFEKQRLRITDSSGSVRQFDLEPMSVAEFYKRTMGALKDLGIEPKIFTRPVEIEVAIPFEKDDEQREYDGDSAKAFWQALVRIDQVFTEFRAGFMGKVSPSHFFWGAFDLAVTRFSGRTAPKYPGTVPNCANWVMDEAYCREVSSAGFWAGPGLGEAAFYSYAYPEPEGFRDAAVLPSEAYFQPDLGEFILTYETVRKSDDPKAVLLDFLQSTYEAAADLADWDRAALER